MQKTSNIKRQTSNILLLALLPLFGCSLGGLFGAPDTYDGLADRVREGLQYDRYDVIRDVTVNGEDVGKMGGTPSDAQSIESKIQDSYYAVRKKGEAAGILWREIKLLSVSHNGRQKLGEKINVTLSLDSKGNRYAIRIRNAWRVHRGVLLSDGFDWLGAR